MSNRRRQTIRDAVAFAVVFVALPCVFLGYLVASAMQDVVRLH
jgi:hypothetical protein